MAIYYVSTAGNDANNGLGPDASDATNKPWRTIGKALGAAGISSGDTVHIGPGVYRETVVVGMGSAVAETFILGDPLNAQGFKDGSGNLLAPQPVRLTAYTTDDKTAATASTLLDLSGRDYLTFENLVFVGAHNVVVIRAVTQTSTNITFRACAIFATGNNYIVDAWTAFGLAMNWLFDRCIVWKIGTGTGLRFVAVSGTGSDYDIGATVKNCFIYVSAGTSLNITKSGSSVNLGGGLLVHNCCVIGNPAFSVGAESSTSIQNKLYNNVLVAISSGAVISGLEAAAPRDTLEDYNFFIAPSVVRTDIDAGANSKIHTDWSYHLEVGQSLLHGFQARPFLSPAVDSPILGADSDASVVLTEDLLGRARPSGPGLAWDNALKAWGPYEYHDFARQETTIVDASGSALKLTGPGDQELLVPVDAIATTITIKGRYDANHGTTNKPQVELVANARIGVSGQTATMTAAVDTWETLTLGPFTPTAKGWVRVRLKSRAAAGNGIAYFDTADVT